MKIELFTQSSPNFFFLLLEMFSFNVSETSMNYYRHMNI
jgi:hypothetical protein